MNTRIFNQRASKRVRLANAATHDRVQLDYDYGEAIRFRDEGFVGRGLAQVAPRHDHTPSSSAWDTLSSWLPNDDPEIGLQDNEGYIEEEIDRHIMDEAPPAEEKGKTKRRKSRLARRPHVFWMQHHRQEYLDELVRMEGRADAISSAQCPDCLARRVAKPNDSEFRCDDCLLPDLVCGECCVRRHALNPLHKIHRWNGQFFESATLKALGLKVQLNHLSLHCSNPKPCHSNLRILHTNGIHDVAILYCGCTRELPKHIQLLRRGFYPGSQLDPRTCATLPLLKLLHLLSVTSKASSHDLYRTLTRLTDNLGLDWPKSRSRALFRITVQWRHLKLLKRGGRANAPTGASGTKEGELAIRCPTCPYPGINVDEPAVVGENHAKSASSVPQILYIAMDANFRLKNQLVSSYSTDPGLGIGMAYFVARQGYEDYVLAHASSADISTCVGFQALAKANTRSSVGLRYTGVAGVSCARSEMIMPNGIGNLQKGERYSNMDYVFASAVKDSKMSTLVVGYDIACQWHINLRTRMEDWPQDLKIEDVTTIPVIGKLHEPAHKRQQHDQYSCNLLKWLGLAEFECQERVWSGNNGAANATKVYGPGTRQDVLDDHFAFWNHEKYIGTGTSLMRCYKAAIKDRNLQKEAHRAFTGTFDAKTTDSWEELCKRWEDAPYPKYDHVESPFVVGSEDLSANEVQEELEKAEATFEEPALHTTSRSSFIALGLQLEEEQLSIKHEVKTIHASVRDNVALKERRQALRQSIEGWIGVRSAYIPGILNFLSHHDPASLNDSCLSSTPEDYSLWLPSSFPPEHLLAVISTDLIHIEDCLRTAQCKDALESIRHSLRIKTRLIQYKNKNVRGQRDSSRSNAVIDRVNTKARELVLKYRRARTAKLALVGDDGLWTKILRPMEDSDVRSYADPSRMKIKQARKGTMEVDEDGESWRGPGALRTEEVGMSADENEEGDVDLSEVVRTKRAGTGETRKTLSWIWVVEGSSMVSDWSSLEPGESERAEWAKSRARVKRAGEEVLILREEMRRAMRYVEWKSNWWRTLSDSPGVSDVALPEGKAAYGLKQSNGQLRMLNSWKTRFKAPLEQEDDAEEDEEEEDDDEEDQGGGTEGAQDNDDREHEEEEEEEGDGGVGMCCD